MKNLFSLVLLLLATANAFGSGASGQVERFIQPDGSSVWLRNGGGEWYDWHESIGGYTVVRDADGFWKYARPRAESVKLDAIEGAVVGRVDPTVLPLRKLDLPSAGSIHEHVAKLQGVPPSLPALALNSRATEASNRLALAAPDGGTNTSTRIVKCIVILAAFADHWDGDARTVTADKGRPAEEYKPLFNQPGYNLDGAVGSVRDYYQENSYGKLTIATTVTSWVQLPRPEIWYGDNRNEVDGEGRCRQMVLDAIQAANAAGFDFAQGDGDGDGFVDLLHVIHSGHSEAWNGNSSFAMWPRFWWFRDGRTLVDGVGIYKFSFTSALRGADSTSTSLCRIGNICHELGHQFGLPDLYDIGGQTRGVGTWCVMGYGDYGAISGTTADGRRPVQFSAHCKHVLGFVQPKILHAQNAVPLPCVEDHPEIHLIRDGSPAEHEYFLVENRQPTGFDLQLPGGLLIWHIKEDVWRNHSGDYKNPAVRLEEAGGADLLAANRYAASSQAWHAGSGIVGGFRDMTRDADCNAMVYQANLQYRRFDDADSYTRIRLNNFSASGAVMTYDLQTVVPTISEPSASSTNNTVNWSAASDAVRYEVQEGERVTLDSFSDGAESVDTFFESWISTGLARRSMGKARTGDYSYMFASKNETNDRFLSFAQSLELRAPFTVSGDTRLSFWMLSHIETGRGFFRVELSKDDGVTWIALDQLAGFRDPWRQSSYTIAQLNARGIVAGDTCRLRFVARVNDIWGWSGYPNYGFAVDDISLSGIGLSSHGNWWTLADNVSTPAWQLSEKTSGARSYRVRALVNGQWQNYSPASIITRPLSGYELWARNLPPGWQGETADADGDGLINIVEYALGGNGNGGGGDGMGQFFSATRTELTGNEQFTIEVNLPEPAPADVVYELLAADALNGPWAVITSKSGSGGWTGSALVAIRPLGNGRSVHAIAENASAPHSMSARFFQLRIAH